MLVSILVPLYNKEGYIEKTLLSVVRQTFPFWEMIIVDDGSTDQSLTKVINFRNTLPVGVAERITIVSQKNKGQSSARYQALCQAKGDLIALLDGDDLWSTKKLEVQVDYLEKNPNVNLLLSNYFVLPEDGACPKAISFSPISKKILGWAKTEYFGGLVESTGLFRTEFLRRYLSPNAPAMSGGLEICLYALKHQCIACTKEYLCAYIENSGGWHLRKDDLVTSIQTIYRKSEIDRSTKIAMLRGLEQHLFFWSFRKGSHSTRARLMISLLLEGKLSYFVYATKTIHRILVAHLRFIFIQDQIKEYGMFSRSTD